MDVIKMTKILKIKKYKNVLQCDVPALIFKFDIIVLYDRFTTYNLTPKKKKKVIVQCDIVTSLCSCYYPNSKLIRKDSRKKKGIIYI
jgi:hypothetical protein